MKKIIQNLLFIFLFLTNQSYATSTEGLDLLVITVATEETDGFLRYKKSVETFDLDLKVFGMNEDWLGGDVRVTTGGAHKLNLLKRGLEEYKNRENLVLFFTDSYDVIFAANKEEILSKFVATKSNLVVSAESTVWPDRTLKNKYPEVTNGYPYLCSGGIIGYAPTYYQILNLFQGQDTDDDQLFYTKIYLNQTLRNELKISLDHTAELVQNLNFARDDVDIVEVEELSRLKNEVYNTLPCVIHGNGPSKITLNRISNYVPKNWHSDYGCRQCDVNLLDLSSYEILPLIQIAVFIPQPVPFLTEFFDKLSKLDYPKSRINIFIYNQVDEAEKAVHYFMLTKRNEYNKIDDINPHSHIDEIEARNQAVNQALEDGCEYQFSVNGNVQLVNKNLLYFLMRKNRGIIAPMLTRPNTNWRNFWGALNSDGYYLRSVDYLSIINREKIGVWNVPYIAEAYLVKTSILNKIIEKKDDGDLFGDYYEADMNFCEKFRDEGIFMYVTNELDFGRTLFVESVQTIPRHPDMWQIQSNHLDWEDKYINPGFWETVQANIKDIKQPCPDVFMFPLFTEEMADHLVDTMNDYGKWSNGKNEDERISGGYENVPTRDIHMNQVGYEKEWLHLLKTYPARIVEKVYPGFYTKAQSIMMFVVRYKPDEQPFLRPHHDASTWTMNVALNNQGIDYEGGGCRFLRYNCSVTNIPKGYALIHPGRLTHYHEGLYTTKGTRYIVVSFVDP